MLRKLPRCSSKSTPLTTYWLPTMQDWAIYSMLQSTPCLTYSRPFQVLLPILSEMASPTPTSDPAPAFPTPPVSNPIVASNSPNKPIMGNIFLGMTFPLGLAAIQLLVGSASIRVPPTTSRHQINSALSMPQPPKRVCLPPPRHDDSLRKPAVSSTCRTLSGTISPIVGWISSAISLSPQS